MFAKAKTSVDTSGLASLSDPLQTIEALSIGIFDPIYDGFRYFTAADGDLFFEANAIATVSYVASSVAAAVASKQDSDPDLTAIAALAGTTGFLTKTAANTWALDTSTYLTTSSASALYVALTGAQTVAGVKTFSSIVIAPSFQLGSSSGPRFTTDGTNMMCRNSADTAYMPFWCSSARITQIFWGGASNTNIHMYGPASGVVEIYNQTETGFDRICLGVGSSSTSGPAIKRNGTAVNFRLANDSADCPITAGQATFSGLVFVGVYTVATLPSASANTGAFAQVTDSSVTSYGSNVAGGGANRRVVYSNGTNWILS